MHRVFYTEFFVRQIGQSVGSEIECYLARAQSAWPAGILGAPPADALGVKQENGANSRQSSPKPSDAAIMLGFLIAIINPEIVSEVNG